MFMPFPLSTSGPAMRFVRRSRAKLYCASNGTRRGGGCHRAFLRGRDATPVMARCRSLEKYLGLPLTYAQAVVARRSVAIRFS
jgi:hypothetical protein